MQPEVKQRCLFFSPILQFQWSSTCYLSYRNISFPDICGYQEIRNCTSPSSSLQSNLDATLWDAALPFDYRAFVGRSHGQLLSVEYNVSLGIRKEGTVVMGEENEAR